MTDPTTVVDVLETAFTSVSGDMMSAIGVILPIALGVGGTVVVITLGWKLFKRFSK